MLIGLTVREYLERVSSGEATPGGGSVSALAGALSAALSRMVCALTVGRKDGSPDLDSRMGALALSAEDLGSRLTHAVDLDAQAYLKVMEAYRMAKRSIEERLARDAAIQEALKEATLVPLSVAESSCALMAVAKEALAYGNKNAFSDGLVALLCARTAVLGAAANVAINLSSIKDAAFRKEMAEKIEALKRRAIEAEADVLASLDPVGADLYEG